MSKKMGFFNFLLAFVLVMSIGLPVFAQGSLIPDTNLEKAIKTSLGLGPDQEITLEALKTLHYIGAKNSNIKSLQGLENTQSLNGIFLSQNQISDLTPLANLHTQNGDIDLANNQISDITPLGSLNVTNYVYFDLSNNQIASLDALKNVTKLTKLYASGNEISNLSFIKNLNLLDTLSLSNNKITSLDGISIKDDVYYTLDFSNNYITDVTGLSSFKNGELDLSNNMITDISPLKNIQDGSIFLTGNPLNADSLAIIKDLEKRGVYVEYKPANRSVERVSGATRYDTAVEIAKKGWQTADTVIITTGIDFPDALAGAPLAYKLNAPILLSTKDSLSDSTKKLIVDLKAKNAIVLGGTSAISGTVEQQLKDLGISNIERLAGANRYETASLIAEKLGGNPTTAVVAFGYNFPDALAVASYAARNGYPILLSNKDALPQETSKMLEGKTKTIVVGGEAAISNTVFKNLPGAVRIGGANRFDTAVSLINQLKLETNKVYIANGRGFADALTGSVLAAKENAPMLLVEQNKTPLETYKLLTSNNVSNIEILGGNAAVTDLVTTQLSK